MVPRLPVALNALLTIVAALVLVPGALMYPDVASAVVSRHSPGSAGFMVVDAALCFGPLLVPGLLLVGSLALRSAWVGDAAALRLNLGAAAGWAVGVVACAAVLWT